MYSVVLGEFLGKADSCYWRVGGLLTASDKNRLLLSSATQVAAARRAV